MTISYTAPKTITKTTMKLVPGDVISTGDMFYGFHTYTILNVKISAANPRKALVTIQFNHGGIYESHEGKNTRWSVVVKEA